VGSSLAAFSVNYELHNLSTPMVYKEQDTLFFINKISRNKASEKMTAKEVWVKDAQHNAGGSIVTNCSSQSAPFQL
jgi:hypothetical protein